MPGHALGARYLDFISVFAERNLEHLRFGEIVQVRRCAVSIVVIYIRRGYARIFQRLDHGLCASFSTRARARDVVGICGRTIAGNFSVNLCTARFRVFKLFEYEDSSSFAHDESATILVEWAGRLFGCVVEFVGEGVHARKTVVTNEPRRIDCGAPDYIISKGGSSNIPVAFVEAKDVNDRDLDGNREHKEQFNRYKNSLDHILFTDYLDFHLYEFGEFVDSVRIAEVRGDKVVVVQTNVTKFLEMVDTFSGALPQKITSAKKLAQMMAAKAKLLAESIHKTLENDKDKTGELAGQWNAFKNILIHDLTEKAFADIYAQTIAYGMFAARLHDTIYIKVLSDKTRINYVLKMLQLGHFFFEC